MGQFRMLGGVFVGIVAGAIASGCAQPARAQPTHVASAVVDRLRACSPVGVAPGANEVTVATAAVRRCPTSSLAHALLGFALFRSGRVPDAVAELDRADQLHSDWDLATKTRVEALRASLRAASPGPSETGASVVVAGSTPIETGAVARTAPPTEAPAAAEDCSFGDGGVPAGIDEGAWNTFTGLIGAGCDLGTALQDIANDTSKQPGPQRPRPVIPDCAWQSCTSAAYQAENAASEVAGLDLMRCLVTCEPMRGAVAEAYRSCEASCAATWSHAQDTVIASANAADITACTRCKGAPGFAIRPAGSRSTEIIQRETAPATACSRLGRGTCTLVMGCGWCAASGQCLSGSPLGPAGGWPACDASQWYYVNPSFYKLEPYGRQPGH